MKHKHADLMLEYAKDAQETDKPWERWEYYCVGGVYLPLRGTPLWERGVAYRRIDPYRKFREAQERGDVVQVVCNWRASGAGEVVFPDNPEWQLYDGDFNDPRFRYSLLPPEFFRIKPKTKTLYKWAYIKDGLHWLDTGAFYEQESEVLHLVGPVSGIVRLDYTAIEVEA
jgi:hypothetical protein